MNSNLIYIFKIHCCVFVSFCCHNEKGKAEMPNIENCTNCKKETIIYHARSIIHHDFLEHIVIIFGEYHQHLYMDMLIFNDCGLQPTLRK